MIRFQLTAKQDSQHKRFAGGETAFRFFWG